MDFSENQRHLLTEITAIISLFISITVLAPLIHETLHILTLKVLKCSYNFSWSYEIFKGVKGGVQPLCTFNNLDSIFFYGSGYLGTFLLGIIPLITSIEEEAYSSKLLFLVDICAAGLLFSLLTSIGAGRDIILLMDVLNLPIVFGHFLNVIIAVIAGYLGYTVVSKERWK